MNVNVSCNRNEKTDRLEWMYGVCGSNYRSSDEPNLCTLMDGVSDGHAWRVGRWWRVVGDIGKHTKGSLRL